MPRAKRLKFDEIGRWSEVKLAIIKEYAQAYSKIISGWTNPSFEHIYVDAFSGAGAHIAKATGKKVKGSPLTALEILPPFKEYHFIDLNENKIDYLKNIVGERTDVNYYLGDCNEILADKIYPLAKYRDYRRALVLLDPYGLHLNWNVIKAAADMGSIEIFLNFPVSDMHRNVFWLNVGDVDEKDIARMDAFWGDGSWRECAFEQQPGLFGLESVKATNLKIAEGFRKRLKDVAGFAHVPKPIPMKNSKNATLYYLFFASHKPVAGNIVKDIFEKYRY